MFVQHFLLGLCLKSFIKHSSGKKNVAQTWVLNANFWDSWSAILRSFYVHVKADFGLCVTCERRVESVVIREVSNRMCSFFFTFVVAFLTDKPFVTYLVVLMILTDMICKAEFKFLRVYAFPTPYPKQESLWFLRERKNVLVITRDAWKGQILLRDPILQRGIGDPFYRQCWNFIPKREL